jgi:exopolyphosphatase / guanosine-5'-triphosphate,3'-diphosphate pyrophosphatase
VAILRVADGLDRSRRGVVEDVRVDLGTDLVMLRVTALDDAELELWGARRRRELFEKVYARELEVVATALRTTSDL